MLIDPNVDKFKEECGVFGVYTNGGVDVARLTYYGLYALQHRGQESAGIAVSNGEEIKLHKELGLLTEAFTEDDINKLKGDIAIGHVRYSTTGSTKVENAQPLLSSYKLGSIAVAHNGNLVNVDMLRGLLEDVGYVFHTTIDTEVVISLIARGVNKGIEAAVYDAIGAIKGSFAMVIETKDKLIGVRDPYGIRPLCLGKIDEGYVLTSESCAFDTIGAEFIRDIEPGEIVIIDENGVKSISYSEKTGGHTCAFEYIYFARPDSVIDGINVHQSRVRAGEQLFRESPIDADVVIGVPDSGIPAAVGYSKASGIPFDMGFVKNRYVGRTFITPSQELRERAVSVKLNPLKCNVEGKRVVLIDDSIVRGTTSRHLIESLRKAGATEVHFRVASPVVQFPCYFGIDISYRKELIGANKTTEEICDFIGCDSLAYLSLDGLKESLGNNSINGFCLGCLNGKYPVSTPIEIDKNYLER
ncbi:amidophosphoribosyltransferase [Clostridium intestinale]|uniref:Amidophosphoribosyltransferase n=1 Tax=Clostridium intestinale TaxID=36845 RepID=A0A7D6VT46_9CLOT|nr:amidophosphoribosyltransferase [Clostridium intestinale]QLY81746.1 amidophosphoribosyltransferase [Clostridium intestinale]